MRLACVSALAMSASLTVLAAEIPENVKDTIRTRVDEGLTTGIAVGFFDADGVTYFGYGATGLADEATPGELTVFEIGSISKVFTGILLADMVLRGEMKLDDPIEKYLPDGVTAPRFDGASITLGSLSDHSSGLPPMPDNMPADNYEDPAAVYTFEQLYAALGEVELTRPVGEQYEYSNFGAGLLGHLLELATGKSYDRLVRERITSLLGMPDTRIVLTKGMSLELL